MANGVIKLPKNPYTWGNTIREPRSGDAAKLETSYADASAYSIISDQSSSSQGMAYWGYKFNDNVDVQALLIIFFRNEDAGDIAFAKRANGQWTYSPAYRF